MLFKLSLKNIKKSFKDYAIYFFTLILGVAIFYIFNALDSQTIMMKVTSNTRDIIKLMTNILSGVSVFVAFVLGFLIIYASRFLIKRRKKEFGIYLTLGMSKRKISMILLFETIFIGILSLAVGLLLGIILSQFMSILVANMFEADLTNFAFTFSKSSCIKTLICFSIMYLFVMIFNTISISKCKLIDLLNGRKKSEKIKLKNPVICIIIFIISSCVLGYSYYLVTTGINTLANAVDIFKPIIMGAVSTFFIFWSLSGLILKIVMSIKRVYYKNLSSFTLRQISSKINTTVMSMTIICLMIFVTICVLSSALSIKNSMTHNLKTLAPVDVEFYKTLDLTEEEAATYWRYTPDMIDDSKILVRDTLKKMNYNVDGYLKDIIEFNTYSSNDILIKDTLGKYYDEAHKLYPLADFDAKEEFIRLSDYNKMAKLFNLEELELNNNEYILVADYEQTNVMRNEALKLNTSISLLGKTYYPKYNKAINGFYLISSNHMNTGIFVVPDDALNDSLRKQSVLIANYNASNDREIEMLENLTRELENHEYNRLTNMQVSTKLHIYESSVGLGAMVTFIGIYLGIIFLISSAAILALKELSESTDNKERFIVLRKIGTDEKMLNKALFNQIAIFFMFPLLIAIIHSSFGIKFCNYILSSFGTEELLPSIIMTAGIIIVIYGGYFLITYFCSKNIIKDKG